jgi:HSP20 family protein
MRAVSMFADLDSILRASQFSPALRVAKGDEGAIGFAIDAYETDQSYQIKANLPGIAKDDINIEIDGNTVKITASSATQMAAPEGEKWLRKERYTGKFERQFTLSADIDADGVNAKLEHGVLALTLPKKSVLAAKKISIQ